MQEKSVKLVEWIVPTGFVLFAGWLTWHMPAFILDFAPPDNDSALGQLVDQFLEVDLGRVLARRYRDIALVVDAEVPTAPVLDAVELFGVGNRPTTEGIGGFRSALGHVCG